MKARDLSIKIEQITATMDYTEVLYVPSTGKYWLNRHDWILSEHETEASATIAYNDLLGIEQPAPAPVAQLPIITSKVKAEDLSYMLLATMPVGNSITLGHFTITARSNFLYTVRVAGSNLTDSMHRSMIAHEIFWPNRKSINALVKSGALDCYLPAPVAPQEEAPAPVAPIEQEQPRTVATVPSTIKQFTTQDLQELDCASWRLSNRHCQIVIQEENCQFYAYIEKSGAPLEYTESLAVMLDVLSWMIQEPLDLEEAQAPAPQEEPINMDQIPYDWSAWQEEQDQINQAHQEELEELRGAIEQLQAKEEQAPATAQLALLALDDLPEVQELAWHQWQPAPVAPQAPLKLSYAMPTGTGTAKLPAPFYVPDYFRLIDAQEEPSLIERLINAGDAFDQWQEESLSIFASPLICALSYFSALASMLYIILHR